MQELIAAKLTVVIPTYNRAKILEEWIRCHSVALKKNNVNLLIINNKSNDSTKEVIEVAQSNYNNIDVIHNEAHLGPIDNVIKAMSQTKTKYIWPIGDSYCFSEPTLKNVLQKIEESPSSIIINLNSRCEPRTELDLQEFDFQNTPKLGGVVSCLGTIIFKSSEINFTLIKKFNWTYFPHSLALFFILTDKERKNKILWCGNESLELLPIANNRKNWADGPKAIEIATKNWVDTIGATELKPETKISVYKSLCKITGLFSITGLLRLRSGGSLSYLNINKFEFYIKNATSVSLISIIMVSLLPRPIATLVIMTAKSVRRLG